MAFQFGLEVQGLGSCCINWPAIPRNERAMAQLLGLDSDEQVVMLMAIEYPDPDGLIPYSERKPLSRFALSTASDFYMTNGAPQRTSTPKNSRTQISLIQPITKDSCMREKPQRPPKYVHNNYAKPNEFLKE